MSWSFHVVRELLSFTEKRATEEFSLQSFISSGNAQNQKQQHASHVFFHFICALGIYLRYHQDSHPSTPHYYFYYTFLETKMH